MLQTPLIINSVGTHQKTFIWLHGMTENAAQMEQKIRNMDASDIPHLKQIFLNAPTQHITALNISAQSWFDVPSFTTPRTTDTDGIQSSIQDVTNVINAEIASGISAQDIVLGGFSQGGTIALLTVMNFSQKLGAVVVFDTYIPNLEAIQYTSTPVFMAHGMSDTFLPLSYTQMVKQTMVSAGINVDWHTYGAGHEITIDMLNSAGSYLDTLLNHPITAAQQHLANYGVSMQQGYDFIIQHVSDPQSILSISQQFGITNQMLADIVGLYINGVTADAIRSFFNGSGLDSSGLDSRTMDNITLIGQPQVES